jgi:hypothetical protein
VNDAIAIGLGFGVYVAMLAGGHAWPHGMPIVLSR